MKYIKVYSDFTKDIEPLNFEERGRLFTAMLEYGNGGKTDVISGNERFTWATAKKMLDSQRDAYEHVCAVNTKNGNVPKRNGAKRSESLRTEANRSESLQEQEQEQEEEQEHKKSNRRFAPPTYEEVREYCSSHALSNVNAESFVDFYESKNWMVGKSKMKDWKAACRNWNRSDNRRRGTGRNSNYEQRTVNDDDFSDLFLKLGD